METIVFDLDDTLYDKLLPLKKTFESFDEFNSISFNLFYKHYEINSDIAFWNERMGIMSLHESRLFRIHKTFKDLNLTTAESKVEKFLNNYQIQQNYITLFPRIPSILEYLIKQQKKLVIITNGPTTHQMGKIKKLQLDRWFSPNQIIISEEVGIAKPNKKIFKLAEKRFYFNSQDAYFIGDSYTHDIVGAYNANWNTIWFNHRRNSCKLNFQVNKVVYSDIELEKYIYNKF